MNKTRGEERRRDLNQNSVFFYLRTRWWPALDQANKSNCLLPGREYHDNRVDEATKGTKNPRQKGKLEATGLPWKSRLSMNTWHESNGSFSRIRNRRCCTAYLDLHAIPSSGTTIINKPENNKNYVCIVITGHSEVRCTVSKVPKRNSVISYVHLQIARFAAIKQQQTINMFINKKQSYTVSKSCKV